MSYFGSIYSAPPIFLVDGVVREKTIQNLSGAISAAFLVMENALGDMFGNSSSTYNTSRYMNSLASSSGTMQLMSPEEPFGRSFVGLVEEFPAGNTSYFLSMDSGGSVTSVEIDTGSGYGALDPSLYTIDGRYITVQDQNANAVSYRVTYDGTYASFGSTDGFLANVIPDPSQIGTNITKPTITDLTGGRFSLEIIADEIVENIHGKEFIDYPSIELNPILTSFIDAGGSTVCPPELISIWKYDTVALIYKKINTNNIYITSALTYEFETDESINTGTDKLIVCLANVSVSDMISALYSELVNHTHGKYGITSPVSHNDIAETIPVSDMEFVSYGKSVIPGNDHPQYLHREGYRDSDPGSFNNAMIGKIMMSHIIDGVGSTDITTSYSIDFGETSKASLAWITDSLRLRGDYSGLSIDTDVGQDFVLKLNTRFKFTEAVQDTLQLILPVGGIFSVDTVSIGDSITIEDGAAISMGEVVIERSGNDVTFTNGAGTITIDEFSGSYRLGTGDALTFGPGVGGVGAFTYENGAASFGNGPLNFVGAHGITMDTAIKIYNNDGKPYFEVGAGEKFYIREGEERGSLDSGPAYIETVTIDTSGLDQRQGVQFKDYGSTFLMGSIYVTGSEGTCPPGYMILESVSGAIFIDSSSGVVDCQNMKYTNIQAGDIHSYGSLSADVDISAGGDIQSGGLISGNTLDILLNAEIGGSLTVEEEVSIKSELSVLGDSVFNSNIEVRGGITAIGSVTASGMIINGTTTFSGITNISGNLNISDDVEINGDLKVNGAVRFTDDLITSSIRVDDIVINSSFESSGRIDANSGISVLGQASVDGFMSVTKGMSIQGLIDAETTTATLGRVFVKEDLFITGSFRTEGGVVAGAGSESSVNNLEVTGSIEQTDTNAVSSFAGPGIFSRNLDVLGSQKVHGTLEIGSIGQNNGISLVGNSIDVLGQTGIIKSSNVQASDIRGIGSIKIPYSIEQVAAANDINYSSQDGKWVRIGNAFFDSFAIVTDVMFIPGLLLVNDIRNFDKKDAEGNYLEYVDMVAKEAYYAIDDGI